MCYHHFVHPHFIFLASKLWGYLAHISHRARGENVYRVQFGDVAKELEAS